MRCGSIRPFRAGRGSRRRSKVSIERGKLADLVILSEDILSIPAARLAGIKVDATMVDGVIRYERGPRGATREQ